MRSGRAYGLGQGVTGMGWVKAALGSWGARRLADKLKWAAGNLCVRRAQGYA